MNEVPFYVNAAYAVVTSSPLEGACASKAAIFEVPGCAGASLLADNSEAWIQVDLGAGQLSYITAVAANITSDEAKYVYFTFQNGTEGNLTDTPLITVSTCAILQLRSYCFLCLSFS